MKYIYHGIKRVRADVFFDSLDSQSKRSPTHPPPHTLSTATLKKSNFFGGETHITSAIAPSFTDLEHPVNIIPTHTATKRIIDALFIFLMLMTILLLYTIKQNSAPVAITDLSNLFQTII